MPFREVSRMEERRELVRLAQTPGSNVSALARQFGITRETVYKWLARSCQENGLADRSRAPHLSPGRTGAETEAAVLALRAAHPTWGGRKLHHALKRRVGSAPAPSTITAILRRNGVEIGACGGGARPFVRFEHAAPNDLWQMDFKGHVPSREGRLHPLTVLDDHSRFNLVLGACANQRTATVRSHLTAAFRRYGLPAALITDNGSPWGDGPGSPFTPLGVWMIDQGIRVAHSAPYHPQTLGKDERFHRTLKTDLLAEPGFGALSLEEAEAAFCRWRQVYNQERPHEALGFAVPADRYRPSQRPYCETPGPFEYPEGDLLRHVQQGGRISFKGATLRVPKAFQGKQIALRQTDQDGLYAAIYRTTEIARLDLAERKRYPPKLSTMSPNTCL